MSSEFCKKCGAQLSTSDNFCSKCGTQQIPQNNTPHVKYNRFSKKTKVGMGVALIVVAFFILGGASGSLSQQQNVQEKSESEKFIDKPLTDILPVRNDIGTEWTISPVKNDASDFYYYTYDVKNFIESVEQEFTRINGMSGTLVRVTAYKYDSLDKAEGNYNELILMYKNRGGYTEIDSNDVDARCYGMTTNDGLHDYSSLICIKSNIIYRVHGAGYSFNNKILSNFVDVISSKIQ